MFGECRDEWRGLRRDPDGRLCWNGWSVFGHILPFVGLMNFPCYADGSPVPEIGEVNIGGAFKRRGLCFEWLGHGFVVGFGAIVLR